MTDDKILDVIKRRMVFELMPSHSWFCDVKAIRLVVSWRKDDNTLETIYESREIETESQHMCDKPNEY